MQLRPYQKQQIDLIFKAWTEGYRKVMAQLSTGGGKTILLSHIARSFIEEGEGVMVIAHRKELIVQAKDKLEAITGLECGVIKAGYPADYHKDIQVASIQSLSRRKHRPDVGLVIFDEAHHCSSKTYSDIIEQYPNAYILGVTATPCRTDGQGFQFLFDKLIPGVSPKQLIADGYLCPFKLYGAKPISTKGVKATAGDFNQKQLEDRAMALIGDVYPSWEKHAEGLQTIIFAVSVAHSKKIVEQFEEQRINAEHIDGTTPDKEREEIIERFRNRETMVLSNVGIFTEGFDCLDEKTEILTPTGWKSIDDEVTDCYSLNRLTGDIESTPVLRKFHRTTKPNEKMVAFKSQHLNVRVTEGHEIHVRRDTFRKNENGKRVRAMQPFTTYKAKELAQLKANSLLHIPTAGVFQHFPGIELSDDELRFVAWFMTDGGFVRRTQSEVSIVQSTVKYHQRVRDVLNKVGFDFRERLRQPCKSSYANASPFYEFCIPKGTHSGSLQRIGFNYMAEYLNKDVAPILHQMTVSQFNVFWEELLLGDGSRQKGKSGWLWCDRKSQADMYTMMAVLRGYSTSYAEETTKMGKTVYRVSCRKDKPYIGINPGDSRSTNIDLEQESTSERVWCLENRNSTIITRREGKVIILGNCPGIESVQVVRPTMSLSLHLQMLGRGLRPSEGKEHCVFIDHSDNWSEHGLPDEDREWSLLPQSLKKSRYTQQCPECNHVFQPLSHEQAKPTKKFIDENGLITTLHISTCPNCRHKFEWEQGEGGEGGGRTAKQDHGDIVEVDVNTTSEGLRVFRELIEIQESTGKKKGWIYYQAMRKPESYHFSLGDWRYLAKHLGYKEGWAYKALQDAKQKYHQLQLLED